ncbi:MAG: peptidyl-prolyl cis-trans isomerase [Desulfarculaceae bacterium]|nr:peptidyl-prolyl cis-trans isomerase [Desulfarculaceae bacterium]
MLALLMAGCSPAPEQAAPTVAWVDGEAITLHEFKARAAFLGLGGDPAMLEKSLRREMIEDLISRRLVLKDAARQGINLDPKEAARQEKAMLSELDEKAFEHNLAIHGISRKDWRDELERQLLMEKALRMILMPRARVGAAQVRDYYQGHVREFQRPEQILALHALLPSRDLAQKLVDRVKTGQDMSAAADALGAPLAEGGHPSWLSRGHMPPALEKKVFALQAGQLAGPLPSTYGFHVVLVKQKRPAQTLSLAQAAPEIQKRLSAQRRESLAVQYLERLRAQARVQYDENFLELGRPASPRSG